MSTDTGRFLDTGEQRDSGEPAEAREETMGVALVQPIQSAVRQREGGARPGGGALEEDAELARRALNGERTAWNALISRYQHRVVVSLLARGVRADRAHELAQETWARLIQQQQKGLLTELRLPNLALTQAAFLAADEARRARRESLAGPVEELPESHHPVDPSASAERRLLSEEQLARAQAALRECPASAQRVFQLACDGQELPHAEVAARVGLSVQRVRQILCEVRKKLRSALEEEAP
ncbi:sigma-70 family RNA polymerase sigma factor [Archangium violaceum]|nr:sigma-70 family RNA polymerase sigma factor [Archangium violaceum]